MNDGVKESIETDNKSVIIINGFYECEKKGCRSDTRKIINYLLMPGCRHFPEFQDVGYKMEEPDKLFEDIADGYSEDLKVDEAFTAVGTISFSIFMELGVTEKRTFRTVWEKKTTGEAARLITAYIDRRVSCYDE